MDNTPHLFPANVRALRSAIAAIRPAATNDDLPGYLAGFYAARALSLKQIDTMTAAAKMIQYDDAAGLLEE